MPQFRAIPCLKAYDYRGRLGNDMDADIAWRIGHAFGQMQGGPVVVGYDARESSPQLADAVIRGLRQAGADVIALGLAGTEEVYFATGHANAAGGIAVTASHNPIDYNGLKLVGRGAAPIADLRPLNRLAESGAFTDAPMGALTQAPDKRAYARHVTGLINRTRLRPLHLLVNAGNGAAGPALDAIADALADTPLRFTRINHTPDPAFPNGIPNPLLPENQPATGAAVRAAGADMGVAWDGDFDRCFLFDAAGRFIPGEYVVGLLARAMLARHPGARIVHDPRVVLNTRAVIAGAGGTAVQSRTGHAFVKQVMRDSGAVYGGEMSAHHYFRDFFCCDSGMIPWLLVAALMSDTGLSLAALVDQAMADFPSSGELNFACDAAPAMARVAAAYAPHAIARDDSDGLSLEFPEWRFNLRASNTEPLLRLNVETRGDVALLHTQRDRIAALITG